MRNTDIRRRRLYSAWQLRSLEIWRWVYGEGRQLRWNLMDALGDHIPTVQSFMGDSRVRDHRPANV